jgi:mono/diheme cytochrome c family protein
LRAILASILVTGLVVLLGGLALIYSGLYDLAATSPHSSVTRWVMETVRTRSIKAHATGIEAPPTLDDPAQILIGVEHFAAHCAVCHGAPGVPKGDIGRGLYPAPPDLATAAHIYSATELFWIIKHGIKMTGMPAWIEHSDEELWAVVAFIKKLPGMSEQDYAQLVVASMGHGAHHGGHRDQTKPDDHSHN